MHHSESEAWFQTAPVRTVRAIHREAVAAHSEWRIRLHDLQERRDLAVIARGDAICACAAAIVAAQIAVELAIIVAIWPEEPAAVLRASWE